MDALHTNLGHTENVVSHIKNVKYVGKHINMSRRAYICYGQQHKLRYYKFVREFV
jgi:hypothetical protein